MLKLMIGSLVLCGTFTVASEAFAGCEVTAVDDVSFTVTPEPICLDFDLQGTDCGSNPSLIVVNNCSETAEFDIKSASVGYVSDGDVVVVLPGETAAISFPIDRNKVELPVKLGEEFLTVEVNYTAHVLDDEGCSATGGGTSSLWVLLGLLGFRRRRA